MPAALDRRPEQPLPNPTRSGVAERRGTGIGGGIQERLRQRARKPGSVRGRVPVQTYEQRRFYALTALRDMKSITTHFFSKSKLGRAIQVLAPH